MRRKRQEKMDGGTCEGNGPYNYGGAWGGGSCSANDHNQGVKNDLKAELWRLCAGGSVYVPRAGEKVFYFPQSHLEQVAAFTQHQQDSHMDIPAYDLPSKILCRVMCVQLKAEAISDEVFAQITLVPESKQDELSSEYEDTYQIPQRTTACSFIKILTASDTSPHGGFSIPKLHAHECLPLLDITLQTPTQELVAKDLHGFEWHFTHKYRGEPKRHLLTNGWSTFVKSKKLVAGDACIFVSGENGELCIGIRRAKRQHNKTSTSTSLISSHSMQLGILTTASHAVATGSMFTVYYHPWMNPFEFIVPVQHYMKSTAVDYSIGSRVQMQIEVEESARRYAGTIISIGDIDSVRWPGSKWRCLEVQWDAIPNTYMIPERVCPWWIEPLKSAMKKPIPILPLPKKARVPNLLCPGLSAFSKEAEVLVRNSAKPASRRGGRVLQDKDYINEGSPQPAQKPPPFKDAWLGLENKLPFVMQDPPHQSLGRSVSFPHEDISTSSSTMNSTGSESLGWPSESKEENYVSFGQPGLLKLFGVNLTNTQMELPSPQFAVFSKISSLISIPPMSKTSIYATIPATKPYDSIAVVTSEKKCKKCHSVDSRSCTKVLKQGTALGRAIDLKRFAGYDELISELDWMFDFGGSLINGSSGWHVTSIDDDGFMTLLRDYPWQDFQSSMVQKIIICPKDGINNLNWSKSVDPTSL